MTFNLRNVIVEEKPHATWVVLVFAGGHRAIWRELPKGGLKHRMEANAEALRAYEILINHRPYEELRT
jgi:ribosomal protein L15